MGCRMAPHASSLGQVCSENTKIIWEANYRLEGHYICYD